MIKPARVLVLGFVIVSYPVLGQNVPKWVYIPPKSNSSYFGVGIGPRYADNANSIKHAYTNAVAYVTREVKIGIRSKFADVGRGGSMESKDFMATIIDSTIFHSVFDSAKIITQVFTHNDAFVLIVITKDMKTVKQRVRPGPAGYNIKRQPRWIIQPPIRRGYKYGVGISNARRYLRDAWDQSADEARLEIAKQLNMTHSSLFGDALSDNNTATQYWLEETIDLTLTGSRIVERYFDAEQRHYYTLIEYKISE